MKKDKEGPVHGISCGEEGVRLRDSEAAGHQEQLLDEQHGSSKREQCACQRSADRISSRDRSRSEDTEEKKEGGLGGVQLADWLNRMP